MPSTVDAVILLGWMEREPAIRYLMQECVFDEPIDERTAELIWRRYKDNVETMPEREIRTPPRLEMTPLEREKANAFLRFHGVPHRQGSIRDVIKIDPRELVVHQPYVVVDRVRQHLAGAEGADPLATALKPHQITINSGINMANVQVPHGEFAFIFNPQLGQFSVQETARHASVTQFLNGTRMLLWAGYHRSYASIERANPDGIERSMLVALTTDADFFVSEQSPNQGLRAMVCGLRPPLFRDFFDERFFMRVRLRKKRYELQIRAQTVGVNID